MSFKNIKHKCGFTLVEVVVATAIILIFLSALIGVYNVYLRIAFANNDSVRAAYIAEEGIEAIKFLRESSWSVYITPLQTSTSYYLTFNNNMWNATTTNVFVDSFFERKINITDVYRDVSSNIVTTGGSVDSNTKKVTVTVSWYSRGATTTQSVSTYITNIVGN